MYPIIRIMKELLRARRLGPIDLMDSHISHHRCWPVDLDLWMELNNGRTLTLYDLGRLPHVGRTGVGRALREKGWGLTVAGSTIRYRRRVTVFSKLTMHTRWVGWDNRFMYMEQSMWRGDECASHALVRLAVVGKAGIVAPSDLALALGNGGGSPALPAWVQAWIEAEATRPWPPER
jgi:acyl-CoA thioesterase FadM